MAKQLLTLLGAALLTVSLAAVSPDDSDQILTIDHFVRVKSSAPSMNGQFANLYVRERVKAGTALRGGPLASRVVIFVHGAGTPGEVAFDVPFKDYSWMAFLANAGFDVFALDFTGYGRSTRPPVMDDPCNLSAEQQASFVPPLSASPCASSAGRHATTIASDWDDLSAVVDYVRALRRVDRVSLIGWSLGGPRAGGFAVKHPEKVERLVLLAPAFNPTTSATPPAQVPAAGAAFNKQSHADFVTNWERQTGCPDQVEPGVSDVVWSNLVASDPVGATWGSGVRRAPSTTTWGWNADAAAKMQVPTLLIAGVHDKQVAPERVRQLYTALGAKEKVFVDLGCSSHNAMWEKNHQQMFRASLEWLTSGAVTGAKDGMLRIGY